MKNFKKLFIALPLVLVMLIMAVPVNAQDVTYKVEANSLGLELKLDKTVEGTALEATTRNVPIWGAVKTYATDKNKVNNASQGAGWYKLLNGGLPMAWREASSLVATEFMIGKNAVETEPKFADYVLPTYQINHVEKVKTTVSVPKTWTGEKLATAYYSVDNHNEVLEAKVPYTKAVAEMKAPGIVLKDNVATFNGQTTAYLTYEDKVNGTAAEFVKDTDYTYAESAYTFAKPVTKGEITINAGKYTVADLKLAFGDDQVKEDATVGEKLTITPLEKTTFYVFEEPLYKIVKGQEVQVDKNTVITMIEDGKEVTKAALLDGGKVIKVTKGTEKDSFVDETLWGLLVIVEEKYVPVTINHHFIVEGSEEIIQTTNVKQEKGVALTANNIKAEWLMEVGEFKYDPTKTEVTEKTNDNKLVIGETIVESYVVDLFYTAGEANADEIDAAFANTNTGVANANVANLPATGAASNVALILSSAALAVVGLFLKK